MNLLELSEQEIIRRNSMEQLRQMGIEPYPAAEYVTNAFSTEIKESFKDDAEPRSVCIAGRIMSRRIMGKSFVYGSCKTRKAVFRCIFLVTISVRIENKRPVIILYLRNCWI